ncbi:MmcQ/YjbR family DNA-binding protein [Streptacidiphilus sp. N1-3]|uniref:MmcQ/YjbR family DNA-binding protein n=1 Tax=Streptacidiphilus alkalitolerans TaxID=3342712 RepID=A0ABV6WY84_9ACTN
MATWDDVRRLALALPETSERLSRENVHWWVKDKSFVWERPLRRTDIEALTALGATAPDGPVLGARVADTGVRQALIASNPDVFFTIPHFDGYPAVLVRLDRIDPTELGELIVEAWLLRAPKRLAQQYLNPSAP